MVREMARPGATTSRLMAEEAGRIDLRMRMAVPPAPAEGPKEKAIMWVSASGTAQTSRDGRSPWSSWTRMTSLLWARDRRALRFGMAVLGKDMSCGPMPPCELKVTNLVGRSLCVRKEALRL